MHKPLFPYGNAAARTFGRAHRHRPYGIVWADCAWKGWFRLGGLRVEWVVSFGWITRRWLISLGQIVRGTIDVVWVDCAWMFAPYVFRLDR